MIRCFVKGAVACHFNGMKHNSSSATKHSDPLEFDDSMYENILQATPQTPQAPQTIADDPLMKPKPKSKFVTIDTVCESLLEPLKAPPQRKRNQHQHQAQSDESVGSYILSDSFLRKAGFALGTPGNRSADAEAGGDAVLDPAFAELMDVDTAEAEEPQKAVEQIAFDAEQQRATALCLAKENVFITGGAGTGKTRVLKDIVEQLRKQNRKVAVTATTGVAALNCLGSTIHSWCGMRANLRDLSPRDIAVRLSTNRKLTRRFQNADVLVVDEVSMMEGSLLERIDMIAQTLRKCPGVPFGGLQVIFCGDFLQLPPVTPRGQPLPYAFLSPTWQALKLSTVVLTTKFRQSGDMSFQNVLDSARMGQLSPQHAAALKERARENFQIDDSYVRLFGSNAEVDSQNLMRFTNLPPRPNELQTDLKPLKQFQALDLKTSKGEGVSLDDGRFPAVLQLKVKTRVMLVQNIALKAGLINGTTGTVTGFLHPLEALRLVHGVWMSRHNSGQPLSTEVLALMHRAGLHTAQDVLRLFDSAPSRTFLGSLKLKRITPSGSITLADLYSTSTVSEMTQVLGCPVSAEHAMTMTFDEWEQSATTMGPDNNLFKFRFPVVMFDTPSAMTTQLPVLLAPHREEWYQSEELTACRTQLPLRQSWAMTVHKSQGLTISKLAVDMRRFFAPGQGYVALSRGVSLDSIVLTNFHAKGIFACPVASGFYAELEGRVPMGTYSRPPAAGAAGDPTPEAMMDGLDIPEDFL